MVSAIFFMGPADAGNPSRHTHPLSRDVARLEPIPSHWNVLSEESCYKTSINNHSLDHNKTSWHTKLYWNGYYEEETIITNNNLQTERFAQGWLRTGSNIHYRERHFEGDVCLFVRNTILEVADIIDEGGKVEGDSNTSIQCLNPDSNGRFTHIFSCQIGRYSVTISDQVEYSFTYNYNNVT